MLNCFDFMDVELLFQEVNIQGIPYLLPVPELPRVRDTEVHICRGTLRQAFAMEKILQNRKDSIEDAQAT